MPFSFCRTHFTKLVAAQVGYLMLLAGGILEKLLHGSLLSLLWMGKSGAQHTAVPWSFPAASVLCPQVKPCARNRDGWGTAFWPFPCPAGPGTEQPTPKWGSTVMQRGSMDFKHCLLCLHYSPVCNINYPANTVAMTLLKAIKANVSISDLHPTILICSWTAAKVPVPGVCGRRTAQPSPGVT